MGEMDGVAQSVQDPKVAGHFWFIWRLFGFTSICNTIQNFL